MKNMFPMKILNCLYRLENILLCFLFIQAFSILYPIKKIAICYKLHNKIQIIIVFKMIKQLNYIWMLQLVQYLNLPRHLLNIILNILFVNDFESMYFLGSNVLSLKNFRIASLPDFFKIFKFVDSGFFLDSCLDNW